MAPKQNRRGHYWGSGTTSWARRDRRAAAAAAKAAAPLAAPAEALPKAAPVAVSGSASSAGVVRPKLAEAGVQVADAAAEQAALEEEQALAATEAQAKALAKAAVDEALKKQDQPVWGKPWSQVRTDATAGSSTDHERNDQALAKALQELENTKKARTAKGFGKGKGKSWQPILLQQAKASKGLPSAGGAGAPAMAAPSPPPRPKTRAPFAPVPSQKGGVVFVDLDEDEPDQPPVAATSASRWLQTTSKSAASSGTGDLGKGQAGDLGQGDEPDDLGKGEPPGKGARMGLGKGFRWLLGVDWHNVIEVCDRIVPEGIDALEQFLDHGHHAGICSSGGIWRNQVTEALAKGLRVCPGQSACIFGCGFLLLLHWFMFLL